MRSRDGGFHQARNIASGQPALLLFVRGDDRFKAAGTIRQLDADVLELLGGSRIGAFPRQANTVQRHATSRRCGPIWYGVIEVTVHACRSAISDSTLGLTASSSRLRNRSSRSRNSAISSANCSNLTESESRERLQLGIGY
jgi:hypothetical protein